MEASHTVICALSVQAAIIFEELEKFVLGINVFIFVVVLAILVLSTIFYFCLFYFVS